MQREDRYTLALLDAVAKNGETTQRQLARQLQVSLGLVNAFMKRLVRKGYFKVTTLPRRRVKYLLTPKGMLEKSRLTKEYIEYSLQYFRQVRERVRERLEDLVAEGVERVALVGVGELAELAYLTVRELGLSVVAVARPGPGGRESFLGRRVVEVAELAGLDWEMILVAAGEDDARALAALEAAGLPREKIRLLLP